MKSQQHLSPEKFIRTKARTLPLGDCYISEDIEQAGEANIVVSRRHQGGKVSFAFYLVDIFCLGVKDANYMLRINEYDWESYKTKFLEYRMRQCSYEEAHNWIYGAIAFADEVGIQPSKTFELAQYMLEEDTDKIPLIEYEFGKNGKYCLIVKNSLEASKYIPLLQKNLGKGNFDCMLMDNDEDRE